ncbi:hypothetical protein jhhlp_001513 [Lomentospora prolificans]|uniref:Chromatin modification-related protein n=1 Tax=Lomentospora prolificans TaxID=41688 RepID=A0A2N3NIF9_9PEZI|nr:hypothetical protein jhhlp_001513 [Lomentospora prolificans]
MKSMKSPAIDAASSRRLQPVRQTRTNPSRASGAALQRTASGRDSINGPGPDQPIDIFPGLTSFTDAITALPKELVRHFTLLKEVDAKISAPEDQLRELINTCLNSPFPQPKNGDDALSSSSAAAASPASAAMSAQNSSTGSGILLNNALRPVPVSDDAYQAAVFGQGNMPRRRLFHETASHINNMLIALDEKNHVINTANEVLQRHLARIEDIWPHLESEFSEEAKYGSNNHWAYPENRIGKPTHNERSNRRDGPSLAAQQAAEEAAARSESRKQAVQAKKNQRNQTQDADTDDHKGEPSKKSQSAKGRKNTAENNVGLGLGITAPSATNGANPPTKRRKVEKPVNGGLPTERAMSTVFGSTASKSAKSTTSPQTTPVPEGQKKRKALPTGPPQAKKRFVLAFHHLLPTKPPHFVVLTCIINSKNGSNAPPSATASPILSSFPDPKIPGRASPVPGSSTPRPGSSRARQTPAQNPVETNTTTSTLSNGNDKARPSPSISNQANGTATDTPDIAPTSTWPKPAGETKPAKEISETPKPEPAATAAKEPAPVNDQPANVATMTKKDTPKLEEAEKKAAPTPPIPVPTPVTATVTPAPVTNTTITTVTTKSGRASKPSTPALATFQEAARSRSSRTESTSKRSHKKSTQNNNNGTSNQSSGESANKSPRGEDEEDGDIDADEPTYCYCNSVSYGAMVACDADGCEKEWFHLDCVGLKVPPKQNVKWYCEDCKERMKAGGKKISAR